MPALGPGRHAVAVGGGKAVLEDDGERQRRRVVETGGAAEIERGEDEPRFAGAPDRAVPGDDAEIGTIGDRQQAERRVGEVRRPGRE